VSPSGAHHQQGSIEKDDRPLQGTASLVKNIAEINPASATRPMRYTAWQARWKTTAAEFAPSKNA
ncbi:hypothetical protein ACFL9S_14270, partial [Erwinia sp. AnSW2-5]|uniref:hypothetical protein n=1 Tax=Erwinia sp. AnSW2-5 TaxID=3367692 RepID=UPI00385CDB5F